MNKKIILGVVIAIIVIAGGFTYYVLSPKGNLCWPYCSGMTDQDREDIKKSVLEAQNNLDLIQPLVIVLSPNGGEKFNRGSKYNVSWKIKNMPSGVDLVLSFVDVTTKQAYAIKTLQDVMQNSGTYEWQIPAQINPGNYVVQVAIGGYGFKEKIPNGCHEDKCYDESDSFFIIN